MQEQMRDAPDDGLFASTWRQGVLLMPDVCVCFDVTGDFSCSYS